MEEEDRQVKAFLTRSSWQAISMGASPQAPSEQRAEPKPGTEQASASLQD